MLPTLLLTVALQLQPDVPKDVQVNGRQFGVLVPFGWKVDNLQTQSIQIKHSSGASFIFRGIRGKGDLETFALEGVDRVMMPLGFATFGEALKRKVNGAPAIQYQIQGNRLSQHRKLLYIAIARDDGFYETIYENDETDFDQLVTDAERMAASIELTAVNYERAAIARVRSVNTAEVVYLRMYGRYGTLRELVAEKLLNSTFEEGDFPYRVGVTLAGRGYLVTAIPLAGSSGRWAFESQQDGVVRYSARTSLAPRGLAGKPVQ
jgi:hypothetical protein